MSARKTPAKAPATTDAAGKTKPAAKPAAKKKPAPKALPAAKKAPAAKKPRAHSPAATQRAKPKTKRQPRGGAVATSPERCIAVDHRTTAMELRIRRLTYKQIGEAMSITEQRAYQLVSEGLAMAVQHLASTASELRELETQSLQTLYRRAYLRATWAPPRMPDVPTSPDVPPYEMDYQAAHLCVRISERLSKLHGIDSPKVVSISNPDGSLSQQPVVIEIVGIEATHGDGDTTGD